LAEFPCVQTGVTRFAAASLMLFLQTEKLVRSDCNAEKRQNFTAPKLFANSLHSNYQRFYFVIYKWRGQ